MPAISPSTKLYMVAKGIMSIAEWDGETPPGAGDYVDVGNAPRFECTEEEETLEHYSSRTGLGVMDASVTRRTGYTLGFDLEEISLKNLQMFLRATLSGTTKLQANTALTKEYAIKFVSDNPHGRNFIWEFWRCKLSPDRAFSLISEEWAALSFSGKGLADIANHPDSPYFDTDIVTESSTSTSTSTSTTSTTTTA